MTDFNCKSKGVVSRSLTMSTRWSVVHSDGGMDAIKDLTGCNNAERAPLSFRNCNNRRAAAVLTTANNQTTEREEDHSSCCGHEKIGGALLNGRAERGDKRACSWIDQDSVWDRREGGWNKLGAKKGS